MQKSVLKLRSVYKAIKIKNHHIDYINFSAVKCKM